MSSILNKKVCTKCKIEKSTDNDNFLKDVSKKDNLDSWCKLCRHNANKKSYRKNRINRIAKSKTYRDNNKEDIKSRAVNSNKLKPWKRILSGIISRCTNKNNKRYDRYGGRGIICLITEEELKELWIRDKAHLLKQPSIDREDNDGNYEFNNCRFIEHAVNSAKDKTKPILQFDLDGNFIKEWNSQTDIQLKLNIYHSSISNVCRNRRKTAGGFVWRYK